MYSKRRVRRPNTQSPNLERVKKRNRGGNENDEEEKESGSHLLSRLASGNALIHNHTAPTSVFIIYPNNN